MHSVNNWSLNAAYLLVATVSISEDHTDDELLKRMVSLLSAVPAIENFQLPSNFSS